MLLLKLSVSCLARWFLARRRNLFYLGSHTYYAEVGLSRICNGRQASAPRNTSDLLRFAPGALNVIHHHYWIWEEPFLRTIPPRSQLHFAEHRESRPN